MFEFGNLRFRPVEKEDLKLLHEWENDFELIMYSRSNPMSFVNMAQLEKKFEEWVKEEKHFHFIVEMGGEKDAIGIARIRLEEWGRVKTGEIGTYIGKKELWGKGVGRRITVALLEMAFNQLNVDRCEAWSVEYNDRAHKALEACGFEKGGIMREAVYVNGRKWNGLHFDILRDEFQNLRSSLLTQVLGEKKAEYRKKHCTIHGY